MKRTTVAPDLYEYQFAPEPGHEYGFNLYALVDGRDVLLIDTAFEPQAAQVLADLESRGLMPRQVVLSHFHPDHTAGLRALPDVVVLGSDRYETTLADMYTAQEREEFPPVQGLTDSSVISFGKFELSFRAAPGHSPCSIYTVVDERYVHVADNLMATNDGVPLVPWAELELVGEHIRTLELLMRMSPAVLLLSHGNRIEGGPAIEAEIADRLTYLRAVLEGGGRASFEEATVGCSRQFQARRWHICLPEE